MPVVEVQPCEIVPEGHVVHAALVEQIHREAVESGVVVAGQYCGLRQDGPGSGLRSGTNVP